MSQSLILFSFLFYTLLVFFISWLTTRRSDNESYFIGNKSSPWYVVAYGMIGASLSGVTFMSVPGLVGSTQFTYMMLVFGYLLGYFVIAVVLLPLYYRLNLTSIYGYLGQRFGFWSHKTGSFFFIISRLIGASFRLFLVVNVLHVFVLADWGISFTTTALILVTIIILYSLKGGIKTIVWTDTLQTTFMILAVIISSYIIINELGTGYTGAVKSVFKSGYFKIVETDIFSKHHYLKQFFSGAFIAIVMTGLDQDMMQKNLSCRTLRESQKNVITFSIVLIFVNFLFLFLGALLYVYTDALQIDISSIIAETSDNLFPAMSLEHLGLIAGLTFLIGLISAAYSSADGALTALTTSFSIDILNIKQKGYDEKKIKRIRQSIHLIFSFLMLCAIVFYKAINDDAIINKLFTIAGYTYGPLLGLFSFGLFIRRKVKDVLVPFICIASPVFCYFLSTNSYDWWGFKFGFELLILNGLLTFTGLLILSKKHQPKT